MRWSLLGPAPWDWGARTPSLFFWAPALSQALGQGFWGQIVRVDQGPSCLSPGTPAPRKHALTGCSALRLRTVPGRSCGQSPQTQGCWGQRLGGSLGGISLTSELTNFSCIS